MQGICHPERFSAFHLFYESRSSQALIEQASPYVHPLPGAFRQLITRLTEHLKELDHGSSGGKPTLLGISKRSDMYLRTLLIHGARSAIPGGAAQSGEHKCVAGGTARSTTSERAAVALANKNVRTVWALLAHGREFPASYEPQRVVVLRTFFDMFQVIGAGATLRTCADLSTQLRRARGDFRAA